MVLKCENQINFNRNVFNLNPCSPLHKALCPLSDGTEVSDISFPIGNV